MSKTRAGRQSHETHRNFLRAVGDAAASIAAGKWKYSLAETNGLRIVRTVKDTEAEKTFSLGELYGELAMWDRKAFFNLTELGFSDFLVEIFSSPKTVVHTAKCEYRLADPNFQTTVQ